MCSSREMKVNDQMEITVAKPVASKPTWRTTFRSFSELLAGAIKDSPVRTTAAATGSSCSHAPHPHQALPVSIIIRPKTVRVLKPLLNNSSIVSTQPSLDLASSGSLAPVAEALEKAAPNCLKLDSLVMRSVETNSCVVYKPLAKPVSKKASILLAHLGFDGQQVAGQEQRRSNLSPHPLVQNRQNFQSCQQDPNIVETYNTTCSGEDHQISVEVIIPPPPPPPQVAKVDRPSYDGYNWRKYGQKQMKGSEYPRSYYKCTHTNCPVKKMVERSLDGQIAEIVYKGEHNHVKPQPAKKKDTNPSSSSSDGKKDKFLVNEDPNVDPKEAAGPGLLAAVPINGDANEQGTCTSDISGDCENGSNYIIDDEEEQEPRSKRRRSREARSNEIAGESGEEAVQERSSEGGGQSSTDCKISGDGFRWRKYGQKVVKGNPFPRSYYRCTNIKCNARKHVERSSDDPRSLITTYEGKHNHDMPTKTTIKTTTTTKAGISSSS